MFTWKLLQGQSMLSLNGWTENFVHNITWWTSFYVLDNCKFTFLFVSSHFHFEEIWTSPAPSLVFYLLSSSSETSNPHIQTWRTLMCLMYSLHFHWPRFWLHDEASFIIVLVKRCKKPSLDIYRSHKSPVSLWFLPTKLVFSKIFSDMSCKLFIRSDPNQMYIICKNGNASLIFTISQNTRDTRRGPFSPFCTKYAPYFSSPSTFRLPLLFLLPARHL